MTAGGTRVQLLVTPEKNVMMLSVHALRLISRAGKREFSGVLYNL